LKPSNKKKVSLQEKLKELKGVREKFLALAIFGSMIIDARALLHERNKNDADEYIICVWMGLVVVKAHFKVGL